MPRIEMPDLERVPLGPHRDLVAALHALYLQAGQPGTRLISKAIRKADFPDVVSHETVAAILNGKSLPRWPKIHSLVLQLAQWSIDRPDPDSLIKQIHILWTATQGGLDVTVNIRDGLYETFLESEDVQLQRLASKEHNELLKKASAILGATDALSREYSPPAWAPVPPRGMAMLHMIYGTQPGASFILPRAAWSIGRIPGNDLVLNDSGVSRHHALIRYDGDRWVLNDLESTNGTFVNTVKIQTEWPLSDNDEIHIGHTRFRYRTTLS